MMLIEVPSVFFDNIFFFYIKQQISFIILFTKTIYHFIIIMVKEKDDPGKKDHPTVTI